MDRKELNLYGKEYKHLWSKRMRLTEFSVKMEKSLFYKKSSEIYKAILKDIDTYFKKIEELNLNEKKEVHDYLKVLNLEMCQNDNFTKKVLANVRKDEHGKGKFLIRQGINFKINLTDKLKMIEYGLLMSPDNCNCLLKQKLQLTYYSKPSESIFKVRDFNDGTYEYELHRCNECKIFWINDTFCIDGPQKGFREPNDSYEFWR